jgi:small redox-active disulfide protein 2
MSEKKGFFNGMFGKKQGGCCNMEIVEEPACCCGSAPTESKEKSSGTSGNKKVIIKIVGSGCAKCIKLAENTEAAAKELGLDYKIAKITDIAEIAASGIMTTPGLIVNEKIVSKGKVLSVEEIKPLLKV